MSIASIPSPELRRIAGLYAVVLAADRDIMLARGNVADLTKRRAGIETRIRDIKFARPTPPPDLHDDLVQAIAADPWADLATDDIDAASEQRLQLRTDLRNWEIKLSLVEQAIPKIDAEIAEAKAAVERRQSARSEAYRIFVIAAQGHLIETFREAFEPLSRDVLMPLVALTVAVDDRGSVIVPANADRVADDTKIEIRGFKSVRGSHELSFETLFSAGDATAHRNRAGLLGEIDRFCRRLAVIAPDA